LSSTAALVAASDKNGNTYLWNTRTGTPHGPVLAGPAGQAAYYTAFSPSGFVVATAFQDGSTSLWSAATGNLLARLHDPGSPTGKEVDSLAFSPDGHTLATADGNGNTTLWNIGPGNRVTRGVSLTDPAGAGVYSVAFASNGMLATGDYDGRVYLWDVASGTVTATFSVPGGSCTLSNICDAVSGLAFNDDGSVLAAGSINGNAVLWSVSGKQEAAIAGAGGPAIWGMSFGGAGTLAVASADGRLDIWKVTGLTATLAGSLADPHSGSDGIGAVAVSADGRYLVAGDTNGSAYLWKLAGAGSP
jgi:WD40 repeat protein